MCMYIRGFVIADLRGCLIWLFDLHTQNENELIVACTFCLVLR